jgi:hypothetical protein
MKHTIPTFFIAAFGVAGLLASACAKAADPQSQPAAADQTTPAPSVPSTIAAQSASTPPAPAVPASSSIVVNPDASTTWENIKDLPYEQRATFIAGLNRLESLVDAEISSLNARRQSITNETDAKEWDFQMKGLVNDQAYLKAMNAEVAKVDSDKWTEEKDRVEAAWQSTQDAYAKVLHSTTTP